MSENSKLFYIELVKLTLIAHGIQDTDIDSTAEIKDMDIYTTSVHLLHHGYKYAHSDLLNSQHNI